MNFVWKPDKKEADIVALLIFAFLGGALMAGEEKFYLGWAESLI